MSFLAYNQPLRHNDTYDRIPDMHGLYTNTRQVVQEFLLARDVVLMCGTETLQGPIVESFIRRVESVRRLSNRSNEWSDFLETPAFRLMQQRVSHDQRRKPLAELLIQNSKTECYEPRDKIYAMLGLAVDGADDGKIRVSYTIDKRPLLFDVIHHIRPQAGDLLRWVRFLMDVLKIDREQVQRDLDHELEHDTVRYRALAANGFTTGKVIRCGPLNDLLELKDSSFRKGCTEQDWRNISEVLQGLDAEDISRLESSLKSLEAASQRPPESLCGFSMRERVLENAQACLVIVFTFGCTEKQKLVGVAYGNIKAGNNVVQFLGNDIAIVSDSEAQSPHVCGCLLFPRLVSTAANDDIRDRITQNLCRSHIIQSKTDCVEFVREVWLQMRPPEMLAMAQ